MAGILFSVTLLQWGVFPTPVSDKQLELMNENLKLTNQITQLKTDKEMTLLELKVCKAGLKISKERGE